MFETLLRIVLNLNYLALSLFPLIAEGLKPMGDLKLDGYHKYATHASVPLSRDQTATAYIVKLEFSYLKGGTEYGSF